MCKYIASCVALLYCCKEKCSTAEMVERIFITCSKDITLRCNAAYGVFHPWFI